tara:strand:+ start:10755 stop:12056 length:1302 start_codon:yes stop_codon:yes gene_type:complete
MYLKQILNKILLSKRLNLLDKKKETYRKFDQKLDQISTIQIIKFNNIWHYALNNIKFYSDYAAKNNLPKKIKHIDELNNFPIIKKNQLIDFFSKNKHYLKSSIKTGGSSGKPAAFPFNINDQESTYLRTYLGRSRININPLDKTALVWGHSHLFEKNFIGNLKYNLRRLKDYQLNIIRLSAYNLSDASIDKYIHIIKSTRVKFLIGYTSCITKLAERILQSKDPHKFSHLRSVVITAENIDRYDIEIIENAFNCECHIEYGTAESGVLGYSSNIDKLVHFFWDDYIYQTNSSNSLIITSIYDRYFPLIRYDTEDVVEIKINSSSHISATKIIGRSNDNLTIEVDSNKVIVHSELFTHILKSIDEIKDFLIIQKEDVIEIQYVSEKYTIEEIFFQKLEKEYKNVNKKLFLFVNTSEVRKIVLPSGKKKWVIVEK